MSDPQQPSHDPHRLPPYASQQPQPGYPGQAPQPGYPNQSSQPVYRQPAQQGYVLNGQSAQAGPASPTNTNPAGRAGLIIGLVGLGIGLLTSVIFQVVLHTNGIGTVGIINALGSLLTFVAALAALILGIIGLRKAGAPHGSAGIAAGLGIAGTVGIAFSYLINTVGALLAF